MHLKSKAFNKTAYKNFPGILPNCLQKLSWHFVKTASKNYAGTLPKLPLKAMPALCNLPLFKHCQHF
jgi:hypothetical protein